MRDSRDDEIKFYETRAQGLIKSIIKSMNRGKSPGHDLLTSEISNTDSELTTKMLHALIKDIC